MLVNNISNNNRMSFEARLKITKKTPSNLKKTDIPLTKFYRRDAVKIGNKKDIVVIDIEEPLYEGKNGFLGVTTKFIRKGQLVEKSTYENGRTLKNNEEIQEYKKTIISHFLADLQKKYHK